MRDTRGTEPITTARTLQTKRETRDLDYLKETEIATVGSITNYAITNLESLHCADVFGREPGTKCLICMHD